MTAYYEVEGWPKDISTRTDFTPQRKVHCNWADRFAVATEIDEQPYPYIANCTSWPSRILIEPFGGQTNAAGAALAAYPEAELTIDYGIYGNAAVIEWITESSLSEPCAPGSRYWQSDGQAVRLNELPRLMRSGCIFHHQRLKVAYIPGGVLDQVNCCNSSPVFAPVLQTTFPAYTLRAITPTIERIWKMNGITNFSAHQIFEYRWNGGYGWKGVYRAETGLYEMQTDADGNPIYDYPPTSFLLV